MNTVHTPTTLSAAARAEFSRQEFAPLFHADWNHTVFIHFAVDPAKLQPEVPFPLETYDGWAYVSLVAFTLEHMCLGSLPPTLSAPLLRALSPCRFLNLRTYVKGPAGPGIYFLAEWLSKHAAVPLGPPVFGLPYRAGQLSYHRGPSPGQVRGNVTSATGGMLLYSGEHEPAPTWQTAPAGSLEEFLLERYTAYTERRGTHRLFRVWHPPWPCVPLELELHCATLLGETGAWCQSARLAGAHYSPGVQGVWMGRPHRLTPSRDQSTAAATGTRTYFPHAAGPTRSSSSAPAPGSGAR